MKTSDSLKASLKKEEGFRANAYKDGKSAEGKQLYSIGYGHQIQSAEQSLLSSTLTEKQASAIFDKDLAIYEAVLSKAKRSLQQNQYDALISFGYNTGPAALAKVLNTWDTTGDAVKTTDHMKQYNKWRQSGVLTVNPTLVTRRLKESAMFLLGEVKKKVHACPNCGYDITDVVNI